MSTERRRIPHNLYRLFSQASDKARRAWIPLGVATAVNTAVLIGTAASGEENIQRPVQEFGTPIGTALEVGAIALSLIRFRTARNRQMQLAGEIAVAEGRAPIQPPGVEVRRTEGVLTLANYLTRQAKHTPQNIGEPEGVIYTQYHRMKRAGVQIRNRFPPFPNDGQMERTALGIAHNYWWDIATHAQETRTINWYAERAKNAISEIAASRGF